MSEEQDCRLLSTEVRSLEADDTIEIALTAEDTLALSRIAEETQAVAILGESSSTTTSTYLAEQYVRSRRWPLVLAASLLGMAIGVALGVVADRMHTMTIQAPPRATPQAETQKPPVRFNNPFDASEVFEFPPGTSDDKVRESVVAVLLQRARDRQGTKAGKPLAACSACGKQAGTRVQ
jgi:hypothetical protein